MKNHNYLQAELLTGEYRLSVMSITKFSKDLPNCAEFNFAISFFDHRSQRKKLRTYPV